MYENRTKSSRYGITPFEELLQRDLARRLHLEELMHSEPRVREVREVLPLGLVPRLAL